MSQARMPAPVLLIVAVFSSFREAMTWAAEELVQIYGTIGLESIPYVFDQTSYYHADMGKPLYKQFLVFQDLILADSLASVKLRTNALEAALAEKRIFPVKRPVNIDPGILNLGKFMLATVKDQAHRIYLGQGIHAEVTLRYEAGQYEPWPWTYADYRQDCVRAFLDQARSYYRARLEESAYPLSRMNTEQEA